VTVIAGYIAGCMATVAAFVGAAFVSAGGQLPPSGSDTMIVSAFTIVLGMALPGFTIFRLLLFLTGRKDWLSFVIAGGLNGVATMGLMLILDWMSGAGPSEGWPWGNFLGLFALGLVAGLACWLTERWLTRLMAPQIAPVSKS
jgi:hypothetical protein